MLKHILKIIPEPKFKNILPIEKKTTFLLNFYLISSPATNFQKECQSKHYKDENKVKIFPS